MGMESVWNRYRENWILIPELLLTEYFVRLSDIYCVYIIIVIIIIMIYSHEFRKGVYNNNNINVIRLHTKTKITKQQYD